MHAKQVLRSIIRYLKGHGTSYELDAGTWAHYRRVRLTRLQLFKVLRPFHDNDAAYARAVDHLVSVGLLRRCDVRAAGGANLLWGLLLQEVRRRRARSHRSSAAAAAAAASSRAAPLNVARPLRPRI